MSAEARCAAVPARWRMSNSRRWRWARGLCLLALVLAALGAEPSPSGTTVVVAGIGWIFAPQQVFTSDGEFVPVHPAMPKFSGDEGPATLAFINHPEGLDVDGAGNLYLADVANARVRKVTPEGIITTVAGIGSPGRSSPFSGDGGLATLARLHRPNDVAVDPSGNLFIADSSNARVRKVDTKGVITTVAGTGQFTPAVDGGPATQAAICHPGAIAVDGRGNLFLSDTFCQRIRKVTPNGTITTVAGGGIADPGDGGPAVVAKLTWSDGLAVDPAGNLFFSERERNRVRKVDAKGVITTVAGTGEAGSAGDGGPATAAKLDFPMAVAVDSSGNLFIAERDRVRRVSARGTITTVAGGGRALLLDGWRATAGALQPFGLAVDPQGNLYVSDLHTHRGLKILGVAAAGATPRILRTR
jgi:trimeric autotransporter adhesin